jgi:hypothetical protein
MASLISAGTSTNTAISITGDTTGALALATNNGTTALTIDTSQNVGIGTSVMNAVLNVQSSGTSTTAGGNVVARLQSNAAGRDATLQLSDNVSNSITISQLSGATVFRTNGTESARIDASGKVGLGTTPVVHLDVVSPTNGATAWAWFHGNTGGATPSASINSGLMLGGNYSAGNSESNIMWGTGYNSATQHLTFSTWNNATTTVSEKMRITSGGLVGIGTNNPGNTLHVYKAGDGQTPVKFQTGNANGILDFYNDSNGWSLDSYGDFRVVTGRTGYGAPTRFYINDTGRVGVNVTPATGNTFRVVNIGSDNSVQFGNVSNGVYLASGGTSFSSYSDIRLKNITGRYETPLEDIAKLDAIKFTWKNDEGNKPCVGVSAQSVETVIPEAIDRSTNFNAEGDTTEYLSVKYTELIPLMIASIQELKTIVDAQAVEIAALKAKVGS